jgi:ATP-binding cassette, subfamily A (ABC1), member 3
MSPLSTPLSKPMLDDNGRTAHDTMLDDNGRIAHDTKLDDNGRIAHDTKRSKLRFVPALLWKNWRLKKKKPVSCLLEVLLPAVLILLVGSVWVSKEIEFGPAGFTTPTSTDSIHRRPLFDLVRSEPTMSALLLRLASDSIDSSWKMSDDSWSNDERTACHRQVLYDGRVSLDATSPFSVPPECHGRVALYKLAIVPDNTFTRQYFFETIKKWYPRVENVVNMSTLNTSLTIPSFEDSVVFYRSEKELEAHVLSPEYGTRGNQPRIFGALVFDTFPSTDQIGSFAPIEYTVRLQSATYKPSVPSTADSDASTWYASQQHVDVGHYASYATGGFMTLQTLIARFVNCMPAWDASSNAVSATCQGKASTAATSKELDEKLLEPFRRDVSTLDGMSHREDLAVNANAIEALLRPLRQAPQSYLGSTVSPFPVD